MLQEKNSTREEKLEETIVFGETDLAWFFEPLSHYEIPVPVAVCAGAIPGYIDKETGKLMPRNRIYSERVMIPKKIGPLDSFSLSRKFREMPILGLFWRFFCLLGFPSERITHTTFHLLAKQDIPSYRHLDVQDIDQLEWLKSSRIYKFNSR